MKENSVVARVKPRLDHHWWILPLAVFTVGRLVTAAFMTIASRVQTDNTTPGSSDFTGNVNYWDLVCNWDSGWYYSIANNGYRNHLPPAGDIYDKSEWAFYPLWPYLIRFFTKITDLPVYVVGGSLALIFATLAVLALYRLLQKSSTSNIALCFLLWMTFTPMAAVFHLGYTESITLFLLSTVFWLIHKRKFLWLLIPLTLIAFTRPIGLALALYLFILLGYYLWTERQGNQSLQKREKLQLFAAGVYSLISFGFWPLISALVLNKWDAYLIAQSDWLDYGAGKFPIYVFKYALEDPVTVLIYTAIIFGIVSLFCWKNDWPIFLKLWALTYVLYIFATTHAGFYYDANGFNWARREEAEQVRFNTSILRYTLMFVVPALPIHLVERISNKKLKLSIIATIAIIALIFGLLYAQNFLTYTNSGKLYYP